MARVKVHVVCRLPLAECVCPDDDDDLEPDDAGEALGQWPGWGPLVPGDEGDAA